jgi:hypothetical protein
VARASRQLAKVQEVVAAEVQLLRVAQQQQVWVLSPPWQKQQSIRQRTQRKEPLTAQRKAAPRIRRRVPHERDR